jgi:nicotinamide mononucleotide transporter
MILNEIYQFILSNMTPIEIWATIFGVISVYLTVKENIWCWPTGLVMVILYIVIFRDAKLYSDMILQIIYVFMQIYGWYYWVYGDKKKDKLPVTTLKLKTFAVWAVSIVIGTAVWGYIMATYTDASFPYADGFITVASLVAQWFLSKKYLQSWWLWIIVDVIAIGVYGMKALYLTSGLYVIFLVLATSGLMQWRKTHKNQSVHQPAPVEVA